MSQDTTGTKRARDDTNDDDHTVKKPKVDSTQINNSKDDNGTPCAGCSKPLIHADATCLACSKVWCKACLIAQQDYFIDDGGQCITCGDVLCPTCNTQETNLIYPKGNSYTCGKCDSDVENDNYSDKSDYSAGDDDDFDDADAEEDE